MANNIKGPWRYRVDHQRLNARVYGNGGHVCEVWSGRHPSLPILEANAKLICEAIPMREALARCLAALTEEGVTRNTRAQAIRAARRSLDRTA